MAHFGGQKEGGHAPANVVSKGDYYIMTMGSIDSLLFLSFSIVVIGLLAFSD